MTGLKESSFSGALQVLKCTRSTDSSVPSVEVGKHAIRQAATTSTSRLSWHRPVPDAFTHIIDTQTGVLTEKQGHQTGHVWASHARPIELNVAVVGEVTGGADSMSRRRDVWLDCDVSITWWSSAAKSGY